jgi:hypothetical protein
MYQLTKKQGESYHIIIHNRVIGTVSFADGKWYTKIGKYSNISTSRKKSVESLMVQMIFILMDETVIN